jgi:hypothetical protein
MNIRPILSHQLLVGDYLGVIASMHQPEHFRRVEKLEYIDADLGRAHLRHDVFYLEAANMGPAVALALRYAARSVPRPVLLEAWPADPRLLERLLGPPATPATSG